ncbi:MAG: Mov34/MPN/PAD-1 family protein [Chloroflexota bacterium]
MSDEQQRSPVLSSRDEPAAAGDGEVVPEVSVWQQASDSGADAQREAEARATSESGPLRRPGPPWIPASAALPAALRDELIDWLRGGLPNEGCGVLVGDRVAEDGGLPTRFEGMRNTAVSPYRYLMDPEEQLRVMLEIDDNDEVVWGIVHSHVASPPVPSTTDVGLAAYPDALYLICSFSDEPPLLRAWTVIDGAVNEVVLEPV